MAIKGLKSPFKKKASPLKMEPFTAIQLGTAVLGYFGKRKARKRMAKQNRDAQARLEEMREQYIMLSDPQRAFVEKHLTFSFEDEWLEKNEVFNCYLKFCKDYRLPHLSRNMFSRRLPDYIPCQPSSTTRMEEGAGKTSVRIWKNIRFKTDEEMKE